MTDPTRHRRLVVGISGASGVVYGVCALEMLRTLGIETHFIMARAAQITLAHRTDRKVCRALDLFGLDVAIPRWS
jgi:3-polyprenyl-4-hydroxybenzoate decarboxylase